jgi:hypothetical protein
MNCGATLSNGKEVRKWLPNGCVKAPNKNLEMVPNILKCVRSTKTVYQREYATK